MRKLPGNAARGAEGSAGRFAARRVPTDRRRRSPVPLLVGGLLLAGAAAAAWWLTTGGVFAVRTIATGNYRFTEAAQLEDALRPLLGRNLWAVDHDAAAEALASLPWIRDVSVRRNLPADVRVEFREWRPLLALDTGVGEDLMLLVEDGRILPLPAGLPTPDLPVLAGVAPVRQEGGGPLRLPEPEAQQVLEIVAAMQEVGVESICAVDFVVARPEGFAIVLQDRQGTVLLGRENIAARLARYVVLREAALSDAPLDSTTARAVAAVRDAAAAGREVDVRFFERAIVSTE